MADEPTTPPRPVASCVALAWWLILPALLAYVWFVDRGRNPDDEMIQVITGAAIAAVALVGGAVVSVIATIVAFVRAERLRWVAAVLSVPVWLFAGLVAAVALAAPNGDEPLPAVDVRESEAESRETELRRSDRSMARLLRPFP